MGWPKFQTPIRKHDLDVIVRPTRIVPPNGGIPLRSRPDARQRYHEVELERWRKWLNMPLVLRPKHYPTQNEFSARMVIAADKSAGTHWRRATPCCTRCGAKKKTCSTGDRTGWIFWMRRYRPD